MVPQNGDFWSNDVSNMCASTSEPTAKTFHDGTQSFQKAKSIKRTQQK